MDKKVFIVLVSWVYNGDSGHDVLAVFSNKENAIKLMKKEVEIDKKDSWLSRYFYDGKFIIGYEDASIEYEENDTSFYFHNDYGCNFTEFWIKEHKIE